MKLANRILPTILLGASLLYSSDLKAQDYSLFYCSHGTTLKTLDKGGEHRFSRGELSHFTFNGQKLTLAYSAPEGANYSVYGDIDSPGGTGIFMGRKTLVKLNGKEYQCKPSWL